MRSKHLAVTNMSFAMKRSRRMASAFFALAVVAGCASTQVTQQTPMVSAELPRPKQIYVYDFIADPAQIPADSSIPADLAAPSTPPTAEQLETGRKLGALIAQDMAADIQAMGLPATQPDLDRHRRLAMA